MTEIEIHGSKCDGDPEGLKFLGKLDWDEWETLVYSVDNRTKANFYDSYQKKHFELTKSGAGIYMIAEIKSSASDWF